MEGVLALMIPVLALATGFVAVLKRPWQPSGRSGELGPAPDTAALVEEVALLREEMARLRERVDFTERLLMDGTPAPRLASSERAVAPAGHAKP